VKRLCGNDFGITKYYPVFETSLNQKMMYLFGENQLWKPCFLAQCVRCEDKQMNQGILFVA
jgi:hypothetical protein